MGESMPLSSRPNFWNWLGAVYLIAVIERPLCDPIADVRDSGLEWLIWVDSGPSADGISTPVNFWI